MSLNIAISSFPDPVHLIMVTSLCEELKMGSDVTTFLFKRPKWLQHLVFPCYNITASYGWILPAGSLQMIIFGHNNSSMANFPLPLLAQASIQWPYKQLYIDIGIAPLPRVAKFLCLKAALMEFYLPWAMKPQKGSYTKLFLYQLKYTNNHFKMSKAEIVSFFQLSSSLWTWTY